MKKRNEEGYHELNREEEEKEQDWEEQGPRFSPKTKAYYFGFQGPEVVDNRPFVQHIFYNFTFHTMDPKNPAAEAFVVSSNKILEFGTYDYLISKYSPISFTDGQGQVAVPGFIDSHAHLVEWGSMKLWPDLRGTTSIDEIIDILTQYSTTHHLNSKDWITGGGWDETLWENQSFPTASDLDEAFPTQPVWLRRIDGHCGWANSAAMETADIPGRNPKGGEVLRDSTGDPTGIFLDTAVIYIDSRVPLPRKEFQKKCVTLAVTDCLANGITAVHDAGISLETVTLYKELVSKYTIPLRIYAMLWASPDFGNSENYDEVLEEVNHFMDDFTLPLPPPGYQNQLVVQAVKFTMDGALGSRTAALAHPYSDDPSNTGLLQLPQAEFQTYLLEWLKLGFQVCTHAIGDQANQITLHSYSHALNTILGNETDIIEKNNYRLRIEHAQVLGPIEPSMFFNTSVIASMQPAQVMSDMYWAQDRLGNRAQFSYEWNTLLETNVTLAFGSDFPFTYEMSPLMGIYAAVTREDPNGNPPGGWYPQQCLTREQALIAYTIDAAFASFLEDFFGSLEIGKFADFVVLSSDLLDESLPPSSILETEVLQTYIGGHLHFSNK